MSSVISAFRSEGGLLPADFLGRLREDTPGIDGTGPEQYHLVPGERPKEAISTAWRQLREAWHHFRGALEKLPAGDRATAVTRERWLLPLFSTLGFGRLQAARGAVEIAGRSYPISHLWHQVPLHLVGAGVDLDARTKGLAGAATASPHSLLQEYLNRSDHALWGVVSNGLKLRLLRDNATLTRQAYVEFDLEAIFTGAAYTDFALLWKLLHESRFEGERPEECWLERWSKSAREQGVRALDSLRRGVEEAILALGRGFLGWPGNRALRDRLRDGELSKEEYYRQLLRAVYRLILLFAAEDRDLLLLAPGAAAPKARDLYAQAYSTARLRRLAEKRKGSRHPDLWHGLAVVLRALGGTGAPELALPPLGGFLFSASAAPDLDAAEISNRDLLDAVRALAFTRTYGRIPRPVDYRNLGPEELGSVYEALLELHPEITLQPAGFELASAAGNERKTTGSYYTPTALIECLLDSALDPLLDEAMAKPRPEEALLALRVCDPACGSGHFLLAAAHRIARRLASVRSGELEPPPPVLRSALRDVIGHCLYGVDINPMAAELCKVNLWLESLEPGRPLSFLDHHIQVGNSLLGTTPALLAKGIPDEAFTAIEGDDREVVKKFKKINKQERRDREAGQQLFDYEPWARIGQLATSLADLERMPDDTVEQVRAKERRYAELVTSADYDTGRFLADAWCAAFVWKKVDEPGHPQPITESVFRAIERNPQLESARRVRAEVRRLAEEYRFFHWHLAFPDVFQAPGLGEQPASQAAGWTGGFDCVLGNPPWEAVEVSGGEAEDKATATFQLFLSGSARFPLSSRGRRNLYALFCELGISLVHASGRLGMVLPTGLATDRTAEALFQFLSSEGNLISLFDFENRQNLFPAVHNSYRFSLVTLGGAPVPARRASYATYLLQVADLSDPARIWQLSADEIAAISPGRFSLPSFRQPRDAEVLLRMHRSGRSLLQVRKQHGLKIDSGLLLNFDTMARALKVPAFSIGTDSREKFLPVYEGSYFHAFDHRFATWRGDTIAALGNDSRLDPLSEIETEFRVSMESALVRLQALGWQRGWLLLLRRQARATDETTSISTLVPLSLAEGSASFFFGQDLCARRGAHLVALFNSYAFNFAVRIRQGGPNLSKSIYDQLPVPSSLVEPEVAPANALPVAIVPRVLELVFTSWSLAPFAVELDHGGPPFVWSPQRRLAIRYELDAAFFHLYGLGRDDLDYILETFPGVKRKDIERHGDFRTKLRILEIYDAMQRAMETGEPYRSALDPPPGDPRAAHEGGS